MNVRVERCSACGRHGIVGADLCREAQHVGGVGDVDAWWCVEGYGHRDTRLPHCECGHWLTVEGWCGRCEERALEWEGEDDGREQPQYPFSHPAGGQVW